MSITPALTTGKETFADFPHLEHEQCGLIMSIMVNVSLLLPFRQHKNPGKHPLVSGCDPGLQFSS